MNKFQQHYADRLKPLLSELGKCELSLVLVGGCVRDFLISGDFVNDVDAEVFSTNPNLSPEIIHSRYNS